MMPRCHVECTIRSALLLTELKLEEFGTEIVEKSSAQTAGLAADDAAPIQPQRRTCED